MNNHRIKLSPTQVDILHDTVESFVDNKKLLHIPDERGEIIGLPFTLEVLKDIRSVMVQKKGTDQMDIFVEFTNRGSFTKMKLSVYDSILEYDVNLEEFDSL